MLIKLVTTALVILILVTSLSLTVSAQADFLVNAVTLQHIKSCNYDLVAPLVPLWAVIEVVPVVE